MHNCEEIKALRKDILKASIKEKSMALVSRKETFGYVSDSDASNQGESKDKYLDELVASVALIVKCYEESRTSRSRRFLSKRNSSAGKNTYKRKDESKCFNYGIPYHFSRELNAKKESQSNESNETL